MPRRFRDEEGPRAYRSGFDEDRDFERTARAPFREFGRSGGRPGREDLELERSSRMHFEPDRGGGYGEQPRYDIGRYGSRQPRSDYEFGYGGFQRFGDPYGFESGYSRTPEAAYAGEYGREGFGQTGEYGGEEFERGARRSAFGWDERHRESQRGRGPKGYARSDTRIFEDICDELTEDPILNASEIDVEVANGEVTLSGTVESRAEKRRAEDDAESIPGVKFVQNNLRIEEPLNLTREAGTTSGTAGGNVTGTVAGNARAEEARERETS